MVAASRLQVVRRRKAVVVVAIKHWKKQLPVNRPVCSSVTHALTVAAMALPGLVLQPEAAHADDEVGFQYGHYQESQRQLYTVPNNANPIEAESLLGHARISLTDRIKFAFNYVQDTWSGATPVTTSPLVNRGNRSVRAATTTGRIVTVGASPYMTGQIKLDKNFTPLRYGDNGGPLIGPDERIVHVLSTASPETRKQGDFKLGYEWDESALDIGGGLSIENDYESHFGNVNTRWDFNQKLTTLNIGASYTDSATAAIIDHDASPYITNIALASLIDMPYADQIEQQGAMRILHGDRSDWSLNLGLSQVLTKASLFETSFGFSHSSGYLENPYKVTTIVFVDPKQTSSLLTGNVKAMLEQRPDERNQFNFSTRFVQHISPFDASLHVGYRYYHDDWDINAHTFDAEWVQPWGNTWTITPRIRYCSQTAANFYAPYLLSKQAYSTSVFDETTGQVTTTYFDKALLPANFSSDQRLSGYGALSGGVTVVKQLSKAISLEAGFEYYIHAGSLKLDGSGEGGYSDFNAFMANAELNVNLAALDQALPDAGHQHHHHSGHGHHAASPAGVMFDHMMSEPGAYMLGYRYMYSRQAGDMLHGENVVNDLAIVNNGCSKGAYRCRLTPTYMDMHMHMLDIMYAPTDWLNLMLMPQFMDMAMNLRQLEGAPEAPAGSHVHSGTGHATGGIGDTGLYALIKLFDMLVHHLHFTLGFSAPTGDVDIKLRRTHKQDEGYIHYGMQLGSGTWDFKPSLTYTGQVDAWLWGVQANATVRMEEHNDSGFAFGDIFQATWWGGYQLSRWLNTTLRASYTEQGAVSGQFYPVVGVVDNQFVSDVNPKAGPMDYPGSYGGWFWDLGLGLNVTIPDGQFAGNRFAVEWLQPVSTDVNGYQLDREGGLSATWYLAF